MTDHYPYRDGDFTVLGPGIVASSDGKTISWRGENYERQEARTAPDNPALRNLLAAAILARIKRATVSKSQPFDALTSLLAPNEFDLADTALGVLVQHLDIGEEEAWCKICRRVWGGPGHRCESDAEQRLAKVRDLRDDLRGVTGARWIADALDRILDQPKEQP